ncbi:MAG: GntR family transcriptional regulator [Syntrophomonadaceae bacterium]
MFWIKLDFHSGKPVYSQIRDNIIDDIIREKLKAEDPMPSIRELARILNINPNTVARAYRELESEGYIYSRPGVGSFIGSSAREKAQKTAENIIFNDFIQVARQAKKYHISSREFTGLCNRVIKEVYGGDSE